MIEAIGWALLHFVWQGAVVGGLAAVGLWLLRRSAADVRYVVGAVALSLMATLPIVTGIQAYRGALPRRVCLPALCRCRSARWCGARNSIGRRLNPAGRQAGHSRQRSQPFLRWSAGSLSLSLAG